MSTVDQLLYHMFSWMEKKQRSADHITTLADELEPHQEDKLRRKKKTGTVVALAGSAGLIGATLLSGPAFPIVGAISLITAVTGATISGLSSKVSWFRSNENLKKIKDVEKECEKCGKEIKRLFVQVNKEQKKKKRFSLDELDECIMTEILNSMARRSGLRRRFNYSTSDTQSHREILPTVTTMCGVLAFFSLSPGGKKSGSLFSTGRQQVIGRMSVPVATKAFFTSAKLVGGTAGLAFQLSKAISHWEGMIQKNHLTEASQSLRDTANAIRRMIRELEEHLEKIRNDLRQIEKKKDVEETRLATVKRCLEAPNRSETDKKILVDFADEKCNDVCLRQWLRSSDAKVYLQLLSLFLKVVESVGENSIKEQGEKQEDGIRTVDVIFVAHGSINDTKIPTLCLLSGSSIQDVLLYSPWNCLISANAAYGIATGRLQTSHRLFQCVRTKCRINHSWIFSIFTQQHHPRSLPKHWNSMKESKTPQIPNIMVSTLKDEDKAWAAFVNLTKIYGRPGRSRIVIPFCLWGDQVTLPFYVVTWVLGLVLSLFRMKATVHLAACLGDHSKKKFDRSFLETQYAYTIDNTIMTASTDMFDRKYPELYQALQAIFRC